MRALLLLFSAVVSAFAADQPVRTIDLAPLARWIDGQRGLTSVAADFTQTRALKALRDPQATPGKLWFRAPDFFRWELGQPARSLLLRQDEKIWLISPKKKIATRLANASGATESPLQSMALMKFPMAASLEDFKRQFIVLDLRLIDGGCVVLLQPRDVQAGKFLTSIEIAFETGSGHLRYFEVKTRDGSTLRNEFQNVRLDQPIPRDVFDFDFTGYKVDDAPQ